MVFGSIFIVRLGAAARFSAPSFLASDEPTLSFVSSPFIQRRLLCLSHFLSAFSCHVAFLSLRHLAFLTKWKPRDFESRGVGFGNVLAAAG